MSDLHVIRAKVDGARVLLPGEYPWQEAQARWQALENARLAGRKFIKTGHPIHYPGILPGVLISVGWFEVRAKDDPSNVAMPTLNVWLLPKRGSKRLEDVIRRCFAGRYEGRSGGWIYNREGVAIMQGWWNMQRHLKPGSILQFGFRYFLPETLTLAPVGPAVVPCDDCGRSDGSHDPEVEH